MKSKYRAIIWIIMSLLFVGILIIIISSSKPSSLYNSIPSTYVVSDTTRPPFETELLRTATFQEKSIVTLAPSVTFASEAPTRYPSVIFHKGPYLLFPGSDTEMEIAWQLDNSVPATLEWGIDDDYGSGSIKSTEYTDDHQHRYKIRNLDPGTKYSYRVVVGNGEASGTFITAPDAKAANLNFFAYGDTRDGMDIHDTIAARISAHSSTDPTLQTFILATGDIVSDGNLDWMWDRQLFSPEYINIRQVFANMAFIPIMGNHDGNGILFQKYFPYPYVRQSYWSFDYGPAHIAMLDQYSPYRSGSDQYNWLKNDLETSDKTWKFIVLHQPGWSASENTMITQSDIVPLAEDYGVAMVFGGHNHYYARAEVNGVTHLTVGGGGAPLYSPNPNAENVLVSRSVHSFAEIQIHGQQLDCTVIDLDGNIIDSFSIRK